eukprot:COSAG01_NODE_61735_length_288_cov_0.788360_1_plen_24_part_01
MALLGQLLQSCTPTTRPGSGRCER